MYRLIKIELVLKIMDMEAMTINNLASDIPITLGEAESTNLHNHLRQVNPKNLLSSLTLLLVSD